MTPRGSHTFLNLFGSCSFRNRPSVQGIPDGCRHTFTFLPRLSEGLPREGASALVIMQLSSVSRNRPSVQGIPDGCRHTFTFLPRLSEGLPREGASALVIMQLSSCQMHVNLVQLPPTSNSSVYCQPACLHLQFSCSSCALSANKHKSTDSA